MSRRTTDKCRDCRPVSLSSTVNDPDDGLTELAHTIGEDELDRRIARKPRLSATDRISLTHDLSKVLTRLTVGCSAGRTTTEVIGLTLDKERCEDGNILVSL